MSDHHYNDPKTHHSEALDEWLCTQCYKTVSATRPPVFNSDNCCCAEFGSLTHDRSCQTSPYDQTYHQDGDSQQIYQSLPQYYASSCTSMSLPEETQHQEPKLTNDYLKLAPEAGHNEAQHLSTSLLKSNLPQHFHAWIIEQRNMQQPYGTEREGVVDATQFLPQDIHLVQANSSMIVGKSSGRSKPSGKSGKSSRSDGTWDTAFLGWKWEFDVVRESGAWVDEQGDAYLGECYPMILSGLTEGLYE